MTVIPIGFTYATYGALTITCVTIYGAYKYSQFPNSYGIIGMMVAIPAYSVIRVIVKEARENSKILNEIYKPTE